MKVAYSTFLGTTQSRSYLKICQNNNRPQFKISWKDFELFANTNSNGWWWLVASAKNRFGGKPHDTSTTFHRNAGFRFNWLTVTILFFQRPLPSSSKVGFVAF